MRARVLAALTLVVSVFAGCYGDSDSFIVAKAKQDCVRLAECNRSFFEDAYDGDMARCQEQQEELQDAFRDLAEVLADYDPEEGKKCVSVSRSLRKDCSNAADDDIADACDRVYR